MDVSLLSAAAVSLAGAVLAVVLLPGRGATPPEKPALVLAESGV
jgi:hypothetical protein